MARYSWFITLMLVFLLAGCGSAVVPPQPSPQGATPMNPTVVYRDPATPARVKVGMIFAIALESNPSTGYQWQLAQTPDAAVLAPLGSEYHPPSGGMIGAAGQEEWSFRAVGSGRTSIVMSYVRPWEKDTPPIDTATFDVVVQP